MSPPSQWESKSVSSLFSFYVFPLWLAATLAKRRNVRNIERSYLTVDAVIIFHCPDNS